MSNLFRAAGSMPLRMLRGATTGLLSAARRISAAPLEIAVVLVLLASGLAWYPEVFSEELTFVVRKLNTEIIVFLLLSLMFLSHKYRDLLLVDPGPIVLNPRSRVIVGVGVTIMVAACIAIRWVHLNALDPYTDETAHLISAFQFLSGEGGAKGERAAFISRMVYWIWEIGQPTYFGKYIVLSRIPGIVFGSLTLIPMYLLGRRISPTVGLIACGLWVLCPWAIGVSRYVREYAFFPFFVLLTLNSFLVLMELGSTRRLLAERIRAGVHLVFVLAVVAYSLVFDYQSTMKVSLIVIAAASAYFIVGWFRRMSASEGRIALKLICSLGAASLIVGAGVVLKTGMISQLGFGINPRFLPVFLSSDSVSPVLWWTGCPLDKIALLFIGLAFAGANRKSRDFALLFSVFALLLAFYFFFFSRYFRPRYVFYLLPFFTIVVAVGIANLFAVVRIFSGIVARVPAFLMILFFVGSAVFSYENLANALVYRTERARNNNGYVSGYFDVTGEYHQDMQGVMRFLEDRISDGDFFITTVFYPVLQLDLQVPRKMIAYYPSKRRNHIAVLKKKIQKYDRGWIVLDERRFGAIDKSGFPVDLGRSTEVEGKTVRLVFAQDEARIYRWRKKEKAVNEQ